MPALSDVTARCRLGAEAHHPVVPAGGEGLALYADRDGVHVPLVRPGVPAQHNAECARDADGQEPSSRARRVARPTLVRSGHLVREYSENVNGRLRVGPSCLDKKLCGFWPTMLI
eukprot:gene1260-biopygen6488